MTTKISPYSISSCSICSLFTLSLHSRYCNHLNRPFGTPPLNVYNLALAIVLIIVIVVSGLVMFYQEQQVSHSPLPCSPTSPPSLPPSHFTHYS